MDHGVGDERPSHHASAAEMHTAPTAQAFAGAPRRGYVMGGGPPRSGSGLLLTTTEVQIRKQILF